MLQTFALRAHRQVKLDKVIGHQLPVGGFPLRIDDKRHLFAHLLEQGPVGLSASKAVLADPPRYRDYWHWPTASKLLKEADRIGFDHQVQYGMWKGYGGATQWNDAGLDFATAGKPLLEWAAEERGRPASELPAHADWLAEGAALTQTGRQMEESVGKGFADRIAAALRRIVRSLGLDEAERFREAAVRHEAQARALGIDPRDRPGAVELAGWARALRGRALPKRVRRTVEAWSDGNETRAPDPEETHRRPATPGTRGGRPAHRDLPAGLPGPSGRGRPGGRRADTGIVDRADGGASPGRAPDARRWRGGAAGRSGPHPARARGARARTGA